MTKVTMASVLMILLCFFLVPAQGFTVEEALNDSADIETYNFSFQPIKHETEPPYSSIGLVFSGGYINVLIPPDASVLSVELNGTSGSINLTDLSYRGMFNLRCYKFAQITAEYEGWDQNALINFTVRIQRNTVDYIPCNNDTLADEIMDRLQSCPYSGHVVPLLAYLNLEHAEQWRGYNVLPVEKNPDYQLNQQNVDYLVITSNEKEPLVGGFLAWKQASGFDTYVMSNQTINEMYIGDSIQLKTREFLKDAFNTWHMECVLIVGNVDTLPPIDYVVYNTSIHGDDSRTTDYYYSILEQPADTFSYNYSAKLCTDFPDFILGRFPFEDSEQIRNMVEKTLDYEQNLSPGEWARTNLHVIGQGTSGGIGSILNDDRPNPILCSKDEIRGRPEGNLTLQALVDFVSEGVGSLYLSCHANPSLWWLNGTEYLSLDNYEQLTTSRLPVIFSTGCHSGKFDVGVAGSESAAVGLLAKPDGGAVAIVAGMSYTPYGGEVYISAYNSWENSPTPQARIPDADYDVGKAFYYYCVSNPHVSHMVLLGDPTLVLATANYDIGVVGEKTQSSLSVNTSTQSSQAGFAVNLEGTVLSEYGNNLENVTPNLYMFHNETKTLIGTVTTDNAGRYNSSWTPAEHGYYTLIAEWDGNPSYFGASSNVTFAFLSSMDQNVFTVESNSTVSEFNYNATDRNLCFTVNGSSGTEGYAKVTVAKNLVADIDNLKVYVDSSEVEFLATETDDSWIITFDYLHSSHEVVMDLDITIIPEFSFSYILLLLIVAVSLAFLFHKKGEKIYRKQQ
ncbi:MAG: hypothetical protein CW716_06060 [Candidatus Bathyarchaeum sp.]|nr:MAG: hypothetical protein CW716_06060 [Candidatus Bathyarchaeum sp.]